MDEQLKALLEGIALKSGQEETKQKMQKSLDDMRKRQEKVKSELKERMQKCHEDLKNALERKIDNVDEKINSEEEKITIKVEEKIAVVEEKIENKAVEDLEKKLLACGKKPSENKFAPASTVPVPASPVLVKLSTYNGKTNWTQFCIISEVNGWTEGVRVCQPAASLRGEAAEVLQTLPDTE
ncbi:uncharacterized protein TNCV_3624901 [Trichonephila clavipes]|nr:uncharacterized protein TNCV_3624901 [Trichonephila clavipes]